MKIKNNMNNSKITLEIEYYAYDGNKIIYYDKYDHDTINEDLSLDSPLLLFTKKITISNNDLYLYQDGTVNIEKTTKISNMIDKNNQWYLSHCSGNKFCYENDFCDIYRVYFCNNGYRYLEYSNYLKSFQELETNQINRI